MQNQNTGGKVCTFLAWKINNNLEVTLVFNELETTSYNFTAEDCAFLEQWSFCPWKARAAAEESDSKIL